MRPAARDVAAAAVDVASIGPHRRRDRHHEVATCLSFVDHSLQQPLMISTSALVAKRRRGAH